MRQRQPEILRDYRDRHLGESILVCGCGVSLNDLPHDYAGITIGVNDIGRRFDPTYLVVLNPRSQFSGERFRYVEGSRAQALFSQLDLGIRHPRLVRLRLGQRGGTEVGPGDALPYTRNSPYVALCLARYMGARRIGLIGVDFTNDHFFAATGSHPLSRELRQIDEEYRRLDRACRDQGVEIFNLSPVSRLTSLPRMSFTEFLAAAGRVDTPATAAVRPDPVSAGVDGMPVAIERHNPGIVGDFMDALAASARTLGCRVTRDLRAAAGDAAALKVVWNGRDYRGRGPALYGEHAWLPRWEYQISPRGINADSHLAPFVWDGRALSCEQQQALDAHLAAIRAGGPDNYRYMQTAVAAADDLPAEFLLVPLQMEWDTNIQRHVPVRFRHMQALVDEVARARPPLPVIYKQHPADVRRGNRQLRLRLARRQDAIWPHDRGNIHQLLKSGRCRGIVALNSNVVHDGLIWDVPAIVLGANVWPRDAFGPFLTALPCDWNQLFESLRDPQRSACRAAYAHYLMRNQWKLADARDPARVAALLAGAKPQTGASPRTVVAIARPRGPLVNVVASDRGWLFEDFKRHFAAASGRQVTIVASDRPRHDADAWIFLRTCEAARSPDPARTVVQVHDLYDDGCYRPGGTRHCVASSAGLVLTHPAQRAILAGSGIDLAARLIVERPIGALGAFTTRSAMADVFTVGWVGRPAVHGGTDIKRVAWFVDAVRAAGGPLRAVLLGERLEAAHTALRRRGIDCRYLRKDTYPIERYPRIYQGFDCVVISSSLEAGPLSLFEALASGVPVVSTPVGWAVELIRHGENGFLVESVEDMAAALRTLRAERTAWFARRAAIRDSLGGYALEGWVQANVELVLQLAGAECAVGAAPQSAGLRPAAGGWRLGAQSGPAFAKLSR